MKKAHQSSSFLLFIAIIFFLPACVCHRPTEPDNHQPKVIIPPTADAGTDQNTFVGSYTILDGSGSQKSETSEYLEWDWTEDESNPARTLNWNSDSVKRTGYPLEGTYTYYLRVNDQDTVSLPDTVCVHVGQRLPGLIEDIVLELTIRFELQNQNQELDESALLGLTELDPYSAVSIPYTPVRSLKGVEYCHNLEKFIYTNVGIDSYEPIANLQKLTFLNLGTTKIKQVHFLSKLTNLVYLDVWGNEIEDFTPIEELINLEYLDLQSNPITDISFLSSLTQLKIVYISGCIISDLTPLENLPNLLTLWVTYCKNVRDLAPIQNLKHLQTLALTKDQISDISFISNMTELRWLYLDGNRIKDISSLEKLISLEWIELQDNLIEDIGPLERNEGLGEGDFIGIPRNPLNLASRRVYIPRLRARGVYVDYRL